MKNILIQLATFIVYCLLGDSICAFSIKDDPIVVVNFADFYYLKWTLQIIFGSGLKTKSGNGNQRH